MSTSQTDVPEAVTYREVQELLRTFAASDWTGLTLRVAGMTITAGRHGPPSGGAPPAAPAAAAPSTGAPATGAATGTAAASMPQPVPSSPDPGATDISGCVAVRSPAVGSFWVAPQPGAPPFAEVGQAVAEGDQLAIVEVMKLMNPVLASQAGQLVQVCALNADLVEYDQVLFWIRPQESAGG